MRLLLDECSVSPADLNTVALPHGCKHIVELIDLYPTLAELAGLQHKAA